MFISLGFAISVSSNTIFKTSSNNAQVQLAKSISFFGISLNSTHLWLNKSYVIPYQGRFCFWVTNPNDVEITIDEWFPNDGATYAQLTLDSPLSTDVTFKIQSSEFSGVPTVTGEKSTSYDAGNKIVTVVANTDVSSIIVIEITVVKAYVTKWNPENYRVIITNMDADNSHSNYLFNETKMYYFQADYWDGDGYEDFDILELGFTDGINWVNASYSYVLDTWSTTSTVAYGEPGWRNAFESKVLRITFHIALQTNIEDAENVDIYLRCKDQNGVYDNWEVIASNYFNIGHKFQAELFTVAHLGIAFFTSGFIAFFLPLGVIIRKRPPGGITIKLFMVMIFGFALLIASVNM